MTHITVVNRTPVRGQALVDLLNKNTGTTTEFVTWDKTFSIPTNTDLLINATSIGLFPNVSEQPDIDYGTINENMVVCDVIPNPPDTPFLKEARARGAQGLDGLGMLVYQGAIAFNMWTGRAAPVAVMHQALAEAFGLPG